MARNYKREAAAFRERMDTLADQAKQMGARDFINYAAERRMDLIEVAHCYRQAFGDNLTQEIVDRLLN